MLLAISILNRWIIVSKLIRNQNANDASKYFFSRFVICIQNTFQRHESGLCSSLTSKCSIVSLQQNQELVSQSIFFSRTSKVKTFFTTILSFMKYCEKKIVWQHTKYFQQNLDNSWYLYEYSKKLFERFKLFSFAFVPMFIFIVIVIVSTDIN